jgi:hypothetical protein
MIQYWKAAGNAADADDFDQLQHDGHGHEDGARVSPPARR